MSSRGLPSPPVATAMVCSGVVTAQFIAGKATRDALYLAHLDVTTLPAMVVATSAVSILLVVASSKTLRRLTPGAFVPLAFVVSAALLLVDWVLVDTAPKLAAPALSTSRSPASVRCSAPGSGCSPASGSIRIPPRDTSARSRAPARSADSSAG